MLLCYFRRVGGVELLARRLRGPWGACTPGMTNGQGGNPWALVSAYTSSTPNSPYAQAVHDKFMALTP